MGRSVAIVLGAAVATVAIGLAGLGIYSLVSGDGGIGGPPPEQERAETFTAAWARGDYNAMYALVSPAVRRRVSRQAFRRAYSDALDTSTATGVDPGEVPEPQGGVVTVPVRVPTRIFGTVDGTVALRFSGGDKPTLDWQPDAVFPGLRRGEELRRRTSMPARATLFTRDRQTLAVGPDRSTDVPEVAQQVVGELGAPPAAEQRKLERDGYPPDVEVGVTGLERIFQDELAGKPGGALLAGRRSLARVRARPGRNVVTSIDAKITRAAIDALGNRTGGIAAIEPSSGEVLALAGLAFSGLQPPGSTMKIVTVSEALDSGKAQRSDTFPVRSSAEVGGLEIRNNEGESCGGTLEESFAESCNSVFAPMGVDVGTEPFTEAAERFGFNTPTGIPGAEESTIPPIQDDAELGSSAIGQGRVLASALQMASVAATIANDGERVAPTLKRRGKPKRTRVVPAEVASEVGEFMRAVVTEGTGTKAAVPGVAVAGKTGTAEVGEGLQSDAWFVGYAPAGDPEVAVGVMFVQAGVGGEVAAPAASKVLGAALGR